MKIEINRDLTEMKGSVWQDFGVKQVCSMILAGIAGIVLFWTGYSFFHLPMLLCSYLAVFAVLPIIFLGFFHKDGMDAMEYIKKYFSLLFSKTLFFVSTEEVKVERSRADKKKMEEKKTKGKKNKEQGKMKKHKMKWSFGRLDKYSRPDEPLYKTPKSVQETLEFLAFSEDGIFQLTDKKWSKTYFLQDVNYETEDEEGKNQILDLYEDFLSSVGVPFKITINHKMRKKEEEKNLYLRKRNDDFDSFRELYNEYIKDKISGGTNGMVRERYLTITIEKPDFQEAKSYFTLLEADLIKRFRKMDSVLIPFSAAERMEILYGFYHSCDKTEQLGFDYQEWKEQKRDVKNDLCNQKLKYLPTMIIDEEKYSRVLYISKYTRKVTDRFMNELAAIPGHSMLTVDVVPIKEDDTIAILDNCYLGVEDTIRRQQIKRNQQNAFSSDISYKKQRDKKDIQDMIDAVTEEDQTLFLVGIYILIYAETKEELEHLTESFKRAGEGCRIELLENRQREGLNTLLPIGVRQIQVKRTMLTESLCAFHPFNVQELSLPGEGAIFYGVNEISRNEVIGNRKTLPFPGGWIFGLTGFGKSMFTKNEMSQVFLNTEDDIIILDYQNEYLEFVSRYHGSYVNIDVNADITINPLAISENREDKKEAIAEKTDYLYSHCAACKEDSLTPRERAIISRCAKILFSDGWKEEKTMLDFLEIVKEQEEIEAEDLALYLEPFTAGSLDMFSRKGNTNIQARILGFGLKNLKPSVRTLGMLVIMTCISNRVAENLKKGKATWIYFEEAHYLLNEPETADFLVSSWKTWRKFGGIPTGITQNSIDLIQSPRFDTLITNSAYIALLKQKSSDCAYIAKNFDISESKIEYLKKADEGKCLIIHGKRQIVVDNTIPKESDLYKMFNTNFYEKQVLKAEEE